MSKAVAQYAAEVWGSAEGADCALRFYVVKRNPCTPYYGEQDPRPEAHDSGADGSIDAQRNFVGRAVPVHLFILRGCSPRFRSAQCTPGAGGSSAAGSGGGGAGGVSGVASAVSLPEIHVLLRSMDDLEPALKVLEFCYKSSLRSTGLHDLLRVRQLASYLQVLDCGAACDAALLALVQDMAAAADPSTILEAFKTYARSRDPELASVVRPLIITLMRALLPHFGCAHATLSSAQRLGEWLQLPAAAMEFVLSSEDFKTDCESTVLVLVLCWMAKHHHLDDSNYRNQLLLSVRLCQLSRPYLLGLLPRLAWLKLPLHEYGLLVSYAIASPAERAKLGWSSRTDCDGFRGPRPKCGAASNALVVPWFISRNSLLSFLSSSSSTRAQGRAGDGGGGASRWVGGPSASTAAANCTSRGGGTGIQHAPSSACWRACWLVLGYPGDKLWLDGVFYRGFSWRAQLAWSPQHPDEARLCLAAYEPVGDERELHGMLRQHAHASINVRAHARSPRSGGGRGALVGEVGPHVPIPIRDFRDALPSASRAVTVLKLPLRRPTELPAGGSAAAEAAADPLWAWGAYIQEDGRVGGELEFRPVAESGAAVAEQLEVLPSLLADLFIGGGDSEEDEPEWDFGEQTTEESDDSDDTQVWSDEEEVVKEEETEESDPEWTKKEEETASSGDGEEDEDNDVGDDDEEEEEEEEEESDD